MKPLIVVSGYARSGTSLMCRMLEASGMSIIVSHNRKDDDNPHGYYESRRVSQLSRDTASDREIVKESGGRVLKVLAHMLGKLPSGSAYRTVFMMRNPSEISRSVERMNSRRMGRAVKPVARSRERAVIRVQENGLSWLRSCSPDHLVVEFRELVEHPLVVSEIVESFFGLEGAASEMASCVDASLWRNRVENGAGCRRSSV